MEIKHDVWIECVFPLSHTAGYCTQPKSMRKGLCDARGITQPLNLNPALPAKSRGGREEDDGQKSERGSATPDVPPEGRPVAAKQSLATAFRIAHFRCGSK